ncbi:MAG: chaperone modulator CbpM [Lautropia sp.]
MKTERIDAVWLEEHYLLTMDDLGDRWGMDTAQLHELIAHGVLEPVGGSGGRGRFSLETVAVAQVACRLQHDLELDAHAVGVVLGLLQQLRSLEEELIRLRARLPAEPADGDSPEADVTPLKEP